MTPWRHRSLSARPSRSASQHPGPGSGEVGGPRDLRGLASSTEWGPPSPKAESRGAPRARPRPPPDQITGTAPHSGARTRHPISPPPPRRHFGPTCPQSLLPRGTDPCQVRQLPCDRSPVCFPHPKSSKGPRDTSPAVEAPAGTPFLIRRLCPTSSALPRLFSRSLCSSSLFSGFFLSWPRPPPHHREKGVCHDAFYL